MKMFSEKHKRKVKNVAYFITKDYGKVYPPKGYVLLRPRQKTKDYDIIWRGRFGKDDWVGVMPVNAGGLVCNSHVARRRDGCEKY